MRHRHERLLLAIETDVHSTLGPDVDLTQVPNEATGEITTPLTHIPADIGFNKPDELTWWDWTVFLLHTAAEIEHALMVQYLYAAYSLGEAPFQGPNVPSGAQGLVNGWRGTIVSIAKEEMGHLITVQNLLRFIGGVLNFEREDFPFRTLYPFRFQLEPLTKTSLAKYVAAEMPENPAQPDELMREIIQRATGSAGGLNVNRVGPLYAELGAIFADSTKLADNDLFPGTADSFQAKGEDWFAFGPIIVRELRTRDDAVNALDEIGEQGEGPGQPTDATAPSHFDRFIRIYQEYPDEEIEPVDWIPFRPVPTNPNTLTSPSSDGHLERGRITDPVSRHWAQLSNVRYRMLLLSVVHALHLEDPMEEMNGSPTMRGNLRDWAFLEMRGQPRAGLRGVSKRLVQLPLKVGVPSQEQAAALPFELPYTLALPDRDLDRWRLHLALIEGARSLIAQIESASGSDAVLDELKRIDDERQQRIEEHLSPP
jgi:ferritin-like protein